MKKSNTKIFLILSLVFTAIIGAGCGKSEKTPIKQDNLAVAYEKFLQNENKSAQEMFGKLTIKNSKNQLEKLELKSCQEIDTQKYECVALVTVKTIRGTVSNTEKITLSTESGQEVILVKSIFNS